MQRSCARAKARTASDRPGAAAQEEITFATHPELCCAKFVCEQMADDEALLLSGARHVAAHTGYSETFRFVGPAGAGVADATWVAIDALRLPDEQAAAQFSGRGTQREVLKALVGFRSAVNSGVDIIATGSWGCGAFNGLPEVKALVQWVAASEAGASQLRYHGWDDAATSEALARLVALRETGATVGQLWLAATAAAQEASAEENFLAVVLRSATEASGRGAPEPEAGSSA